MSTWVSSRIIYIYPTYKGQDVKDHLSLCTPLSTLKTLNQGVTLFTEEEKDGELSVSSRSIGGVRDWLVSDFG